MPARRNAIAKLDIGGHHLAFRADLIGRVARLNELDLRGEPRCDLADLFGLEAPEDRYAVQTRSGEWVLLGISLAFDASEDIQRQRLPALVAEHCIDMGVIGLAVVDERIALLLDLRRLPFEVPEPRGARESA